MMLKEPNESIKISLIDTLLSLKNNKLLPKYQDLLSICLGALSKDESWRVRYALADKLHEVRKFQYLKSSF